MSCGSESVSYFAPLFRNCTASLMTRLESCLPPCPTLLTSTQRRASIMVALSVCAFSTRSSQISTLWVPILPPSCQSQLDPSSTSGQAAEVKGKLRSYSESLPLMFRLLQPSGNVGYERRRWETTHKFIGSGLAPLIPPTLKLRFGKHLIGNLYITEDIFTYMFNHPRRLTILFQC